MIRLALLPLLLPLLTSLPAIADEAPPNACADQYVQGQVLRKNHRLLRARQVLRQCARSQCKDFIVRDCSNWLDLVEQSIPAVVLAATDDAGNTLADVAVTMDGDPMASVLDGNSIEVDPGPHVFEFTAADGRKVQKSVVVSEGDKWGRIVVTFPRPKGSTALPLPAPDPAPRGATNAAPPALPWKPIGLVMAGGGLLSLTAGLVLGVDAIAEKNAAHCNAQDMCTTTGDLGRLQSARTVGDFATGFLIAGGILTASGALLWALAPSPTVRVAAGIDHGNPELVLSGAW